MPTAPARPSLVHQVLRPKRTRVKTGCLSCRLRRKKCDEVKPICSGCRHNHLICSLNTDVAPQGQAATLSWQDPRFATLLSEDEKSQASDNATALESGVSQGDGLYANSQPFTQQMSMVHPLQDGHRTIPKTTPSPLSQLCSFDELGSSSLKHPTSRILFEHYAHQTAEQLSIYRGSQNPFITCVIPLARSDSMIMDSILAISGAHICYTIQGLELRSASSMHYTLAVRQLKHELTRAASGELLDLSRVLLTILILSITESVSANSQGTIFHHLRAGSHFIPGLIVSDRNNADNEMRAFLFETYAYLVSVANITVNTEPAQPTTVLDPYVTNLEKFQNCKAAGLMFGFGRSLLTLIPSICVMGYNRLREETTGNYSFETVAHYKSLQSKIENWQEPLPRQDSRKETDDLIQAAKIYKTAILIFLHTAFYARNVTDPELLTNVDTLIDNSLTFIHLDMDSPVVSVLLWPCMIIGSCLRDPIKRQYLRSKILQAPFNMTIVLSSIQLLDWLWEDGDSDAYGPYGLGIVMKKHGVMHSIS